MWIKNHIYEGPLRIPPLKQGFFDQKLVFSKIDTFTYFRRYWKCVNLWETTVYSWTTVESIFLTSSKHGFIHYLKVNQRFFKEIESCDHLFRRVILLDQKRKGMQTRHVTTFFLNLNSIKKLSKRYSDFGRKISWGFDNK